jgi:hypothetical protein
VQTRRTKITFAPSAASPQANDGEEPARAPSPTRLASGSPLVLSVDPMVIKGAAFYDAVGRPDLASAYRVRHGWAVASRVMGTISLTAGAALWAAA